MYDFYDYYGSYTPYSNYSSPSRSAVSSATSAAAAVSSIIIIIAVCILSILIIVATWKMFKKAGRKPWESLIPIHSGIVTMEMAGVETYWYFLNFVVLIPVLGVLVGWIAPLILAFWVHIKLAHSFGKSTGFGVLMTFFPFVCYPILGFGSAQYIGPQDNNIQSNSTSQQPAQPYQPVDPQQPVWPQQPVEQQQPVQPQQPVQSYQPVEPQQPAEQQQPTEPQQPVAPQQPTNNDNNNY